MKNENGATAKTITPVTKVIKLSNIARVRNIFLSGRKVTAKDLNTEIGFNDARKVISDLRGLGMIIHDYRHKDGHKDYWANKDIGQLELFKKEDCR